MLQTFLVTPPPPSPNPTPIPSWFLPLPLHRQPTVKCVQHKVRAGDANSHENLLTVGTRQNAKFLSFYVVLQADGAGVIVVT